MSKTIDSRVVEMRFDNQQFESNVKTSMNTLDKLKASLNLSSVANGLQSVNEAAKRLNFDPIGNGIEQVKLKFSLLDSFVINTFNRISNSIITTGKKLVSAFTIDPVKSGLQEYETQINAIQTILANTESKGTTLQDVNRALNELNLYADKTIYNFTQMTRNIGTFTAAGLDLKTSVSAIQGIANVAAVSGSTSEQASRAMYQLSQALSSGTVRLMDWNSVVNAGMGGQVFQDALKATSRECVNVAKNVNTMSAAEQEAYRISHGYTEDQLKNVKEYAFNVDELIETNGSFRESLQAGWITADVLARTLNKFTKTGAVEYISEMTGASVTSIQELQTLGDKIGWDSNQVKELALSISNNNEKMAENVISIGRMASTAEDAATKVKTFTQLMNTLKEAAQSGWTQTWQLIIGDFGEAKALFTSISDTVGAIIGESANARNELLSGGLSTGWKQLLNAGINDAEKFEEIVKDVARTHSINIDGMIDSEHDFQDALKNGWLTTQILEESIRKYGKELEGLSIEELKAKGYTIEDAQAYTELKEALDNGSLSLEDFRKKIMRSSGRENIIDGLKNSFEVLMSILEPISDAFKQVFPPATAEQLYSLTEKFLNFTKTLKPTTYQLVKLGQTFRGIFSAIDIVLTVIKQLGSAIFNILGNFKGLETSILTTTASIGDWLYDLRNSVKETDIFGGAVEKINGFLQKVVYNFKNIGPAIENFKKGIANASNGVALKAACIFEKLGLAIGKIGVFLNNSIDKIKEFGTSIASNIDFTKFEALTDILKNVWTFVQKVCGNVVDAIVGMLRNGDIKSALDAFNSGVIGVILLKIKDMLKIENIADTLSGGFLDQIKSVFSGLTGMFDSVQESLKAWQQNLQADTIMKIASAIAILAISLTVLAAIKPENLTNAIVGITTLFGELIGSMAALNKIGGFDKSFGTASTTMIKMSAAVLILTFALEKICDLSIDQMIKGLISVGILLGELAAMSIILSKYGGKVKSCGTQMILIAVAMEVFADVCSKFGNMSWETILKGVSGIGLILLEFVGLQKLLSMIKPKKMLSSALSLVLIGAAMEIFSDVCSKLGSMEWEALGKAGAAIGGILLLASGFGLLAGLAPGMVSSSIALVIIAAGLEIMSDVCSKLGAMEWKTLGKAGAAMGGILLLASGFGLLAGLAPGMMASSAALLIMSAAMSIMADVCSKLGSMEWEALGKAGAAIGGILLLASGFGLLAGLAPGMVASAAALLIMAGALSILTPVMIILGTMSWEGILKGLVGIAGAFTILGLAGLLLTPLIPSILGLSAAVALLGVGCLACGAGVSLLAAGLTTLAVGGGAGIAALIAAIRSIIDLIPFFMQTLGDSLIILLQVIGDSGQVLFEAVTQLGLALISALSQLIPPLLEVVVFALVEICRVLSENVEPITDYVLDFLVGLIKAISDKIDGIVQVVVNLCTNIILALGDAVTDIVQAAIDLAINLINGLAQGIEENAPRVREALINLCKALIGAFCEFFGIHSPSTVFADFGVNIVQGLINGIGEFISNAVSKIIELCSNMINAIKSKISEFKTKGAEIINNLKSGISSKTSAVISAIKNFASKLVSGIKSKVSEFKTVGKNMIDGLKNGINNAKEKAIAAAKNVASSIKENVEKFFKIKSPSRVFMKIGGYVVEGLANGISDSEGLAIKAAINMSEHILAVGNNITRYIENDFKAVSKTMQYGVGAVKSYVKQYSKLGLSIKNNSRLIKDASNKVKEYATNLYKDSDAYKEDCEQLKAYNEELDNLKKKREELRKELASGSAENKEAIKNQLKEINEEIKETQNNINNFGEVTSQHIAEAFTNMRDSIKSNIEDAIDFLSVSLDTGVDLFNKMDKSLNNIDPFSKFNDGSETDPINILDTMKSQIDGVDQWKANIEELASRGLGEPLLNYLKDLGPQGTALVRDFMNLTGEELKQANEYYDQILSTDTTNYDILGTMESSIDGVKEWKANLESLKESGLCDGLLKQLEEMGPEGADKVRAFLQLTGEELSKANELYEESMSLSADQFLENYAKKLNTQVDWAAGLKKLAERGFDQGIIEALAETGQESGQAVLDTFLAMTPEQMAELNEKYGKALSLPDETADSIMATCVEAGENSVDAYAESIDANSEKSEASAVSMSKKAAKAIIDKTKSKWTIAGANVMLGFIAGINGKTNLAQKYMKQLALKMLATIKSALGIHSPSREFMKIGEYVNEGFANGLDNSGKEVINSISSLGKEVISNAGDIITGVSDAVNGKTIATPTITPVINMNDISAEKLKITSNLDTMINEPVESMANVMATMQSNIERSNDKVVSAITDLRKEMNDFYTVDNEKEIALYLDSKKMASTLAKPMSRQFGILSKRGI